MLKCFLAQLVYNLRSGNQTLIYKSILSKNKNHAVQ